MRRARITLVALGCLGMAGCDFFATPSFNGKRVEGGDAARGQALIASGAYGCAACHTIPDIRTPRGTVGPPLEGMAERSFIAGQLPNKPGVLIAFLIDPPALVPNSGMPDVGLDSEKARHIAAYLYTLEPPDAL